MRLLESIGIPLGELEVISSEEIRSLRHDTQVRAAGLIECLQSPPTKSGYRVYFLLIEDERGLLQATIFHPVYERYDHILHREGPFLLESRVEQTTDRGFSFLVKRVELAKVSLWFPGARAESGIGFGGFLAGREVEQESWIESS